jgi:hypothetical protein
MRFFTFSVAVVCASLSLGAIEARAQNWQRNIGSYALKSGESVEISNLYLVVNCQSQLVGPVEVSILEGPPGVTATAAEAMVVPRAQQCSKPVKGAKLVVSAGQVEDTSNTLMTLRVRYPTKDGVREQSLNFMMQLFP